MFDISEELKKLPDKPGVYIMHDANDKIIYVGKAVVLKNRVRQYFQNNRNHSPKIKQMVKNIAWFEYIVVDSEMEALVLECNLIKEHRPKYNTMLKDDKHYPYICVTVSEDFPRILIVRERKKDRYRYFGPYTSAMAVHETIEMLNKTYFLRPCSKGLSENVTEKRACIYANMGQCKAPCVGGITKEEYAENVEKAISFLENDHISTIKDLEKKMADASEKMEYEKAAEYRDLIFSIKKLSEQQRADEEGHAYRDIVAVAVMSRAAKYTDGEVAEARRRDACVQVFFERDGKMVGREHYFLQDVDDEPLGNILLDFIKQYYSGTPYIPKEIILSEEIPNAELISDWLTGIKGSRVYVKNPKRGEKERLVELACSNAEMVLRKDADRIIEQQKKTKGAMDELSALLGMDEIHRVESFDISNTNGYENVASMVVFEDGKPKKADYRKFKTRTVSGPDDYASMYEVLTRRFEHAKREMAELSEKYGTEIATEKGSFTRYPDLLLMDGGKGQVNMALKVLSEQGIDIPVCGMVKDDNHRTRGLYFNNEEVEISTHGEAFKLITRIQDETHRFAIEYHRQLRSKAQTHSILDDIPGIGDIRRRALMKKFKTLDELKSASVEELQDTETMNAESAKQVYKFFHG